MIQNPTTMQEQEIYYTVDKPGTAEFKDRGSKFIAYAWPITSVDEFKARMEEVKKEHPKASHHCFAYRIGTDKNTFRVSDDGEPSGTAGKPILGQIDSKELTNVLIVVVRYFGGTLLGVPGLINAYKMSASLVLQMVPVTQRFIEVPYIVHFDYSQINDIMMVVKQTNSTVIEQELGLFCHMKIGISKGRLDEALYRLNDIRNVEVRKL
ncbi:YigZ family protein [Paraflavitalea sp. CAU 1676]|uniref:IMPACT family protein n=1 Tax=Paraflavitalea sp. CAU 1676 TaxID=3032598 RepID=UPI0023D9843A|nr:YigZ family protein [Paraflavitalea sp. CAU 1676]MDF2192507.1 YigZ family protein [Paraflavitalea sp. CAU 1676]